MEENITLIEKYTPKTLEEMKLPTRIMNILLETSKRVGYRLLLYSTPGTGKCLGYDTDILMYDGSIKKVQDIVVGDKLMGPDSTPRTVLSLARGREMLYKIIPNKGVPIICNESHILSVIESGTWNYKDTLIPYNIEDIDIKKALNLPKNHRKKLFRVPLNFKEQNIEIDPYILGYWLGDGFSSGASICCGYEDADNLYPILRKYAESLNMGITEYDSHENTKVFSFVINEKYGRKLTNTLIQKLRNYNLINNKHIPKEYLFNSYENRIKLFSGLIDSDGGGDSKDKTYDFALVNKRLSDDLAWLARSLGYYVNQTIKVIKGVNYYRCMISGDFENLQLIHKRKYFGKRNQIKNHLVSGFKIQKLDIGDYYGFEIDGDKRFLLGDFTVTHNTSSAKLITKGHNVLYLSGSNDFNIQTLREKVYTFANNFSVDDKQKTVIIDEAENIRNELQDAFKIILDKAKSVNFIFITNEVQKMNDAIRSRCTNIEYNFNSQELKEQQAHYIKYTATICSQEGIEFDNSGLKELYKQYFPDFRHLLIILQQLKDKKVTLTAENIKNIGEIGVQMPELYEILESHLTDKEFYQRISAYRGKEKECILALGEPFFGYLNDKELFEKTLQAAVINSDYSTKILTTINKFATFFSCCIELRNIFNK